MRHVALYLRISQDRRGRAEGVATQERQGREYAASAWPGLPVVVHADNDISAANGDHRPGYEALLAAIDAGQVAHLWTVEQSRLERREVGWFELAAKLVSAGITEVHTRRDGVVRVGDVVAGIKAILNAEEVRKLKERINDKLADNAAEGRPPGSRPFGLEHALDARGGKTYEVVAGQAEAIRWAAERVLAGWSLSSVAAALRARGMTGPHRVKVRDGDGQVVTDEQGNPVTRASTLTAGSVRKMLTNPTTAGLRVHKGVIVGKGNWPAILDEDTWQACRARLSGPREVTRLPNADGSDGPATYPVTANHTGFAGRKYVLTGGLAVCGVCGAPLVGSLKQLNGARQQRVVPYLLCNAKIRGKRVGKGCIGIMLAETEQYVVDALFAELDKPEFLGTIAVDDHAARREEILNALAAVEGKRGELAAMWGRPGRPGELTTGEWQAASRALAATERDLRAELAGKPAPPARVSIEEARSAWPSMDLGEQREFLRLFIDRVTINRAKPGTKGFDPGRVAVTWRYVR